MGILALITEKRYLICVLCFFATCCAYIERTGFSVAFTALCKRDNVPERIQGTVMGAFYIGYAISQVPGGMLAQRIGGRRTLIISFLGWSLACAITPSDVRSALFISVVRVAVGIFQGFLIPSVHTVLSEWVLPHERAKATSLCTSGMYLGSAAAIQFLPGVAKRAQDPSIIFRAVAGLGLLWVALWVVFGEDVRHREALIPITHAAPTAAERSAGERGHKGHNSKSVAPTPWRRILSHPATWCIVINNFTFHYIFYIVMNWMPTYFAVFLGRDLQTIGIGKPLPYLVMFAMSNAGGWGGDGLISAGYSVGAARKIINTVGFTGAVVNLMAMPSASTVTQGLVILTLCLGASGFARGGFSVNHMDIAPKYAGILMGISNTAGTVSGLIGVSATGFILEAAGGSQHAAGWFQAHLIATAMAAVGVVIFMVYGRGERLFN
jgi:MFS transporter, ACS family, solute carrier family 17 (sodium-dependent inorganic phosphate cotransporter), other